MPRMSRRGFVESLGAVGAMLGAAPAAAAAPEDLAPDRTVRLSGDGIGLSPRAYATLLAELAARAEVEEDSYLLGGEIERFERQWATLLGKETAVFMPSGTLANQLALRALAGARRRVIVPETSHIYNDTGDACQTLSATHAAAARAGRGDLHPGRRRGGAGADCQRPGGHRRRGDRHREPGAPAVGPDVRLGGAGRRRGAGPRARHRPPPRRRPAVHRLGLHRPQPGRLRRAVRHRLRVAVEVLQLRPGGDPRRPARVLDGHVPHPPDVRRQPGRRLAGGAGRPPLHGRVRRAVAGAVRGVRGVLSRASARIRGWRSSASPTAPT